GADVQLYVNEYNVLQFSSNPQAPFFVSDNYANWYREHGEAIEAAGGQVDGYGVQYYALLDANGNNNSPHSPARMQQVFQNLSITGKKLALTESACKTPARPVRPPRRTSWRIRCGWCSAHPTPTRSTCGASGPTRCG